MKMQLSNLMIRFSQWSLKRKTQGEIKSFGLVFEHLVNLFFVLVALLSLQMQKKQLLLSRL